MSAASAENADFRVLHGVKVRVHPEAHPRGFQSDYTRWRCVVDNLEAAQKCLTAGERSLYYALAECKARALQKQRFCAKLAGEPGFDDEGSRLPF